MGNIQILDNIFQQLSKLMQHQKYWLNICISMENKKKIVFGFCNIKTPSTTPEKALKGKQQVQQIWQEG